jgi:hypothetical protein
MEGKMTRVGASEPGGERVSKKEKGKTIKKGRAAVGSKISRPSTPASSDLI